MLTIHFRLKKKPVQRSGKVHGLGDSFVKLNRHLFRGKIGKQGLSGSGSAHEEHVRQADVERKASVSERRELETARKEYESKLEEITETFLSRKDLYEDNPGELDQIEEQLFSLESLKRKHQKEISELLQF